MNAEAQIRKYKGHVKILAEELRALIESFELLRPIAEDPKLLKRFRSNEGSRGLRAIRRDLIFFCVLGITKLVYDKQTKSPTVNVLIGALLEPKHDPIRSRLKDVFSVPIPFSHRPDQPLPNKEDELRMKQKRQDVRELSETFDRYLSELQNHRDWFDSHEREFKELRDERIAHLEAHFFANKYELSRASGPTWGVMKQAIERLVTAVELLLEMLHGRDEGFDHHLKLVRENADAFWSFSLQELQENGDRRTNFLTKSTKG